MLRQNTDCRSRALQRVVRQAFVSSATPETTNDRLCAVCGLTIPSDLAECPHDEGAMLVARAQNLVRTVLSGHFEITALVGIGGMSAVYKARDRFLGRDVAVKILHPHLASHPASLKRFEQEAKAISHLAHPNIVNVFEYGISPKGQPYLIMDYLAGVSLAGLLKEEQRLSVPRALDLFIAICDALAHAHKKGILHRDIKPSNVMLIKTEQHDEFVKLVDFGLAKLMPGADMEVRQLTQTGEVFGSPLYMSPEQVMGQTLDARSDIFSMGCVMYEVLSGVPPFVGENIMETMYKRVADDVEPLDPALKIPKELETVVMLCLSRQPEGRYQTMLELMQDLELVKQGAGCSSKRIRGFKQARLTKIGSTYLKAALAAAAITLPVLVFAAVTSMSQQSRGQSAWARYDREGQKHLDSGAYKEAESELTAAVAEAEKFGEHDRRLTLSLEKLAHLLRSEKKTGEAEKVEARLSMLKEENQFGDQESNLYELAEMTLALVPGAIDRKKSPEFQRLAEKLNHLSLLFIGQQDYEKAIELLQKALSIEQQLKITDEATAARTLTNLAVAAGKLGNYEQAQSLFQKAMQINAKALGPTHPAVASSLYNLAIVSEERGKYADAEQQYRQALNLYQNAYGKDAPEVAMTITAFGGLYRKQNRYAEAEPLFKEAIRIYQSGEGAQGLDRTALAHSLNNLADLLYSQGKYAEAAPLYERALNILELAVGSDSPSLATILNNLAVVRMQQHQFQQAEPFIKRALAIRQRTLPAEHPEIGQSLNSLAELKRAEHKYAEAEALYKQSLEIAAHAFGLGHPDVAVVLNGMGELYEDQGRLAEAEQSYKQALATKEKLYGADQPQAARTMAQLARVYLKEGKLADADGLLKKALTFQERTLGPGHPDVVATLDGCAALMYKLNRPAEAINYQARALAAQWKTWLPWQ